MNIRRCRNLEAVRRFIALDSRFSAGMKQLKQNKTQDHHLLLSPVASLALMIDESKIDWPTSRPLRVLIMNTGYRDYFDAGQWYRYVPSLLGHQREISVTACNVVERDQRRSREHQIFDRKQAIRAYRYPYSLTQVVSSAPCEFDIAVCFSHFHHGGALLEDLKTLGKHEIPLYFASFSPTHALLNHLILKAHSAEPQAIVGKNPFALVEGRAGEQWNRVLSKVPTSGLPIATSSIDEGYASTLNVVATVVLNTLHQGDPGQHFGVGSLVKNSWVHTFDSLAIDPKTGVVLDLNTDKRLGTLSQEMMADLDDYDPSWSEEDRLVWAAFVRFFIASENIVSFPQRDVA